LKKIWTYIISKSLSDEELNKLLKQGEKFVSNWISHENKLDASFKIYKNRIIIVEVNEHVFQASGCGIDKLTRFIKEIEIVFNIELLNRLLVAYQAEEKIEVVHSSKIKGLLTENIINPNTIVYNTAIANEQDYNNWEEPIKISWLKKYI